MKFPGLVRLDTRNNLEQFLILRLTPWTQEFLRENFMSVSKIMVHVIVHMNVFSWNFQDRSDIEQGTFEVRLFHAWLDCFTFLNTDEAEVCARWVLLKANVIFKCRSWTSTYYLKQSKRHLWLRLTAENKRIAITYAMYAAKGSPMSWHKRC